MRTLTVLLALLALASFITPAHAQFWVATGRYSIDDSSDGNDADNSFRVGNASATAGAIGAATFVSGNLSLASAALGPQIGVGTIDMVNLAFVRGWGSLIMLDGTLSLNTPGNTISCGNNGVGYLTQTGGTLNMGAAGKEIFFGGASTSGGFARKNAGYGEGNAEMRGGVLNFATTVRVGGYNYWKDADPLNTTAWDPSGHCKGVFTQTGGTITNASNMFVGFFGADGTLSFLKNSVYTQTAEFLQIGNAGFKTYTAQDGSTATIGLYGKAILKVGKDATVSVPSFLIYDNASVSEFQVELASTSDYSQVSVSGAFCNGAQWDTAVPDNLNPKLVVTLANPLFTPVLGDKFDLVTYGSLVADTIANPTGGNDPFSSIVAPALSDPTWYWNVDFQANKMVLEVLPEPATLALLAMGGLALIRRRR